MLNILKSQKVAWHFPGSLQLVLQRCRFEDLVISLQIFIEFENTGDITTLIIVVWRRPDRRQLFTEHILVPLHHQLVRSTNQRHPIDFVELIYGILPEQIASSSIGSRPAIDRVYMSSKVPSGSDQSRSQIAPSCGISLILSKLLISSMVLILGDKPPCTQKILSSTMAEIVR